ncbi:hypothetical protein F5B20DRAFT_110226 [Whalleya microplaca]|nr:hypothetical protein F5B20DRAFT_110226 [Whalleya microplaca]
MSRETCQKVETCIVPTPPPVPIRFLQGVVGFSANDSASQLGKSLAGVQFLGLAAALITTMTPFVAGSALQMMLRQTAEDKTLLPTIRQLKALLESLEPRCHTSGFIDSVIGYYRLVPQTSQQWNNNGVPNSPVAIEKIVDAFRQLNRIGGSTVTRVTIQSTACVPWLAAFTTWCIGIPPSIYLENGTSIIENSNSSVDIIALSGPEFDKDSLKVTIYHTIDRLVELAEPADSWHWRGMASFEAYGKWLLKTCGFDTGDALQALNEALPFALSECLKKLRFSRYVCFDHDTSNLFFCMAHRKAREHEIDKDLLIHRLSPFPDSRIVAHAASLMFPSSNIHSLAILPDGFEIFDLPMVKTYIQGRQDGCIDAKPITAEFRRRAFVDKLAWVVADALCVSLFHMPEDLRLWACNDRPEKSNRNYDFGDSIRNIISRRSSLEPCIISSVVKWALRLTSHPCLDGREDEWIMSSFKGQAIYPMIFDTQCIEKNGYLTLSWLRGTIQHNGDKYSVVHCNRMTKGEDTVTTLIADIPVTRPSNLVPVEMVWKTSDYDFKLAVSLSIKSPKGGVGHATRPPSAIWSTLAKSLILEGCIHEPREPLPSEDPICHYIGPMGSRPKPMKGQKSQINVVAIDGADDLRLLALTEEHIDFSHTSGIPTVIRKQACISCCLELCKKAGYLRLIL